MFTQNTKRFLGFAVVVTMGLIVIGNVLVRSRSARPQSSAESETLATQDGQPALADAAPVLATTVVPAAKSPSVASPATTVTTISRAGGGAAMLRIKAGAVLATVNGTPIELKDLLPLAPGNEATRQIMPAERYAFLLDRAVDREVTIQNARVQGLDLTESQREQLAKLRARSESRPANVFDDLQHNPANAEFEAGDAAAFLLQAALAEKAGVPSRDVTAAQVEQYYQQHRSEFVTLPADPAQRRAAWERIDQDIRVKLAREAQARHDESFEKFVEQLRASAEIVRTKLTS